MVFWIGFVVGFLGFPVLLVAVVGLHAEWAGRRDERMLRRGLSYRRDMWNDHQGGDR
jgi:hypothetical protein